MRLILVDDHAIVREGLKAQFQLQGIVEVVGEADNGEQAVALAKELSPDAMIMDITLPRLNGIEAVRQIHSHDPGIKFIALSIHAEHVIVREALRAGCHAYVLKTGTFQEINVALEAVNRGDRYLSPAITHRVVEDFLNAEATSVPVGGLEALSPRERQVLQLTAEGRSVKEIALHLHLSTKTIDNTRRRLMEKLDEHSIAGLTKFAIRAGLTSAQC